MGGPEGGVGMGSVGKAFQVVWLHPASPGHPFFSLRLSKAITSCIMALVCAINLYFVISYLPSLPHPAYFGLVALLAIGYVGLAAYLVLESGKGRGGQKRETRGGGGSAELWPLLHSCSFPRPGPVASPMEPPF